MVVEIPERWGVGGVILVVKKNGISEEEGGVLT